MPTTRRQMPRRIYPQRILGMGLGGMVVGVVLWGRHASAAAWLKGNPKADAKSAAAKIPKWAAAAKSMT